MKTSQDYRDGYATLQEQMAAMTELAKEEKRDFSDDEKTKLEALESEMEQLDKDIAFAEKVEARIASKKGAKTEVRHTKETEKEEQKIVRSYNFLEMINCRAKGKPLTGLAKEMHEEAEREARASGLDIQGVGLPSMFLRSPEKRDITAGSATNFGNTIQTDIGDVIDYLWPRTSVERLGADMMTGLTSNISFPRETGVPTGTWEGENDANAESTPTTNTLSLTPNRLGTFVDVSKQLLLQSNVPSLDARVRRSIELAIGSAVDTAAINGSGASNQPTGILNTSGIGDVAGGTDGLAPTWAHIVELETDVAAANADLGTLAYLTTPGIRGALKGTEKASSTAQFIWDNMVMGGIEDGRRVPGEGQLNGYRAMVSTLVPSNLTKGSGTDLHAIIFGNWQELMVAQFGGLDIIIDPYTQATSSLLRIVVNSWWDIAVAHAASFSAMKDAIV